MSRGCWGNYNPSHLGRLVPEIGDDDDGLFVTNQGGVPVWGPVPGAAGELWQVVDRADLDGGVTAAQLVVPDGDWQHLRVSWAALSCATGTVDMRFTVNESAASVWHYAMIGHSKAHNTNPVVPFNAVAGVTATSGTGATGHAVVGGVADIGNGHATLNARGAAVVFESRFVTATIGGALLAGHYHGYAAISDDVATVDVSFPSAVTGGSLVLEALA